MRSARRTALAAVWVLALGGAALGEVVAVRAAGGAASTWLAVSEERAGPGGVVGGPQAGQSPVVARLVYRLAGSGRWEFAAGGSELVGEPEAVAVVGRLLHVVYGGGNHLAYGVSGQTVRGAVGKAWRILSLCCDGASGRLYGLGRRTAPTTGPETSDEGPVAGELMLLGYEREAWGVLGAVPAGALGAERWWLVAGGSVVELCWVGADGGFWRATWRDGGWSLGDGAEVGVSGTVLDVVWTEGGLRVVVAETAGGSSGPVRVRVARMVDGAWRMGPALRTATGPLLVDGARVLVTAMGQGMAVGDWSGDGEIRIGAVGADGVVRLESVDLAAVRGGGAAKEAEPRPWLAAAVVAAIVLMLFWRRESAMFERAALPAHVAPARPWRRGVAFVIDAVPGAGVTALMWWGVLGGGEGWREWEAWRGAGAWMQVAVVWGSFGIVHVTYCTVMTLVLGQSFGKRVMGCRVISEDGRPAAAWQIVVRGLFLVMELSVDPNLPLLPLLLLVVLTRNRQRLGDMVARTLVVEQRGVGRARPIQPPGRLGG